MPMSPRKNIGTEQVKVAGRAPNANCFVADIANPKVRLPYQTSASNGYLYLSTVMVLVQVNNCRLACLYICMGVEARSKNNNVCITSPLLYKAVINSTL